MYEHCLARLAAALVLISLGACAHATSTSLATAPEAAPAPMPDGQAASPIPAGFHTVTPHLVVTDVNAALQYYQQALGAEVQSVLQGDDGTVMHAEIRLGDSIVMLSPEQQNSPAPPTLGGTNGSLYVYVVDVDALFTQALQVGGEEVMAVADMFWGDRIGSLKDPFGHHWTFATHVEELTDEEFERRGLAFAEAMEAGKEPLTYEVQTPASSYIAEGCFNVTPSLIIGGPEDIDLYQAAFGAEEEIRMTSADGRIIHAEIRIGDSKVMLSSPMPGMESMKTPSELGGAPLTLMLYTPDVDGAYAQAVQAGATAQIPVNDMFWGDRWGQVQDQAGHEWGIATHQYDYTPEQILENMRQQLGGGAPPPGPPPGPDPAVAPPPEGSPPPPAGM